MNPEQPINNPPENELGPDITPEDPLAEKLTGIQQAVEQKFGIKCPPLTWNIFFGHHNTKQDFEEFIATVDNPDVLVMENAGWYNEAAELYNKISRGEAEPKVITQLFQEKHNTNDFSAAFAEWLHNKNIPIVSVEGDGDAHLQELRSIDIKYNKFIKNLDDREQIVDYQQALEKYSAFSQEWALAQKEREEEIVDNIPDRLGPLLQADQPLQHKDALKITMFYGAFHTALSHELAASGENVSRQFQAYIFPYDVSVQLMRSYRFDKIPPPELIEQALFLRLLAHDDVWDKLLPAALADIPEVHVDIRLFLELRRQILAVMSPDDIRHYYEMRKNATPEERLAYVKSFLEKNK